MKPPNGLGEGELVEVARVGGQSVCECWFLDVGQGASNVILLGEGRALVIDCGPQGSKQTSQLLQEHHVDTIEALVISHNDSDHDYTVGQILSQYRKAVKEIFFLSDRPIAGNRMPRTWAVVKSASDDFPTPKRLETDGEAPKVLFSEDAITLSVLYPDLMANVGADSPNQTSAILKLSCGNRRVIFSGDATTDALENLAARFTDRKPLSCDAMTIPHHGGRISGSPANELRDQTRLYSEIIKPTFGIISVGSSNQTGHPLLETLQALVRAGVRVLCTQMTGSCAADLEAIRALRGPAVKPSRSFNGRSKTQSGRSRDVACFGSIVAEISEAEVAISNLGRHEQYIRSFSALTSFDALCRQDSDKP